MLRVPAFHFSGAGHRTDLCFPLAMPHSSQESLPEARTSSASIQQRLFLFFSSIPISFGEIRPSSRSEATREQQLLLGKVVVGFGEGPWLPGQRCWGSSTAKLGLMNSWVKPKPDSKRNWI